MVLHSVIFNILRHPNINTAPKQKDKSDPSHQTVTAYPRVVIPHVRLH